MANGKALAGSWCKFIEMMFGAAADWAEVPSFYLSAGDPLLGSLVPSCWSPNQHESLAPRHVPHSVPITVLAIGITIVHQRSSSPTISTALSFSVTLSGSSLPLFSRPNLVTHPLPHRPTAALVIISRRRRHPPKISLILLVHLPITLIAILLLHHNSLPQISQKMSHPVLPNISPPPPLNLATPTLHAAVRSQSSSPTSLYSDYPPFATPPAAKCPLSQRRSPRPLQGPEPSTPSTSHRSNHLPRNLPLSLSTTTHHGTDLHPARLPQYLSAGTLSAIANLSSISSFSSLGTLRFRPLLTPYPPSSSNIKPLLSSRTLRAPSSAFSSPSAVVAPRVHPQGPPSAPSIRKVLTQTHLSSPSRDCTTRLNHPSPYDLSTHSQTSALCLNTRLRTLSALRRALHRSTAPPPSGSHLGTTQCRSGLSHPPIGSSLAPRNIDTKKPLKQSRPPGNSSRSISRHPPHTLTRPGQLYHQSPQTPTQPSVSTSPTPRSHINCPSVTNPTRSKFSPIGGYPSHSPALPVWVSSLSGPVHRYPRAQRRIPSSAAPQGAPHKRTENASSVNDNFHFVSDPQSLSSRGYSNPHPKRKKHATTPHSRRLKSRLLPYYTLLMREGEEGGDGGEEGGDGGPGGFRGGGTLEDDRRAEGAP
uniref:Uncharacterized protein n=1 Tax=Knipowitschia caucasica TaxID=637954 RepID=A0AAV2J525_KNICA